MTKTFEFKSRGTFYNYKGAGLCVYGIFKLFGVKSERISVTVSDIKLEGAKKFKVKLFFDPSMVLLGYRNKWHSLMYGFTSDLFIKHCGALCREIYVVVKPVKENKKRLTRKKS